MNKIEYFDTCLRMVSDAITKKKSKLRLRSDDFITGFILKQKEKIILDFIEKTFDIDLTDIELRGIPLYDLFAYNRSDLELIAEYIFNDGTGEYFYIIANDKNYYINFFKEMIFY